MDKSIIPKHRPKSINLTLIVLSIILNVHFVRCLDENVQIREGAIPVFKFQDLVQNVALADDHLFVAGLNFAYLLKDEYSTNSNYKYFMKAFFSEPKNRHLSTGEFQNQSLALDSVASTISSCTSPDCRSPNEVQNFNKILVKTTSRPSFFILCGTAYTGKCSLAFVAKNQLQIKDSFTSERFDLIASRHSSILMPIKEQGSFILAHEPDDRPDTQRPPIVSKLLFSKFKNATLNQIQFSFHPTVHGAHKAMINIADKEIRSKTRMHFITGFIYENFAFILKTEKKEGQPLTTRLGRVCLDDSSFFSYTEIQLSCLNETSSSPEYNYASAAYFGRADSYLSKKTDTKLKSETLFVTFNLYDNRQRTIDRSKGSMLCAFTIEQIMQYYSHAVDYCYAGASNPNIGLMTQYSAINKPNNDCTRVNKGENYLCLGNSVDSYVEYRLGQLGTLLFEFKEDVITSLATTVSDTKDIEFNTFVLGSDEGKILKLARAYDEQLRLLHTFKIHNQSNDMINPNPMINSKYGNVYFTAGKHMIKFPMNSCSIYSTCKQCIVALDNLKCGWCSVENQNAGGCMNESECTKLGKDENFKTSFLQDNCPPIIETFSPESGPLGGGTIIDIRGENLCNPLRFERDTNNYKVDVTIGKQYCRLENCTDVGLTCKTTEMKTNSNDAIKVCTVDKGPNTEYSIDGCTVSLKKFNYTKTEVFSIDPKFGPIGGGTKITLIGHNLNAGRDRVLKIKEVGCTEISVNNSHLECIIEGREIGENLDILDTINDNGEIILEIDGSKYRLDGPDKPNVKFLFKPNPTVVGYHPKAGLRNVFTNVTIKGRYFTSAHQLQLRTSMYSISKAGFIQLFSKCTMVDNSTLNCVLPKVPDEIEIVSAQSPLNAEVRLVPDGSLMNISNVHSNVIRFFYYPFPRFNANFSRRFNALINAKKQCSIEFRGENLSDQYKFNISLIKVEKSSQNVTNVDEIQLTNKRLSCTNVTVRDSNSLMRCLVDLSNESIDGALLNSVWMLRVEIPNQEPTKIQLVEFGLGDLAAAKMSYLIMFIIGLITLIVLIAAIVTCYLYRDDKIQFNSEKKFPHFSVTYNSSPLMRDQTMIDSPFIRQSSQNGKFAFFKKQTFLFVKRLTTIAICPLHAA